MVSKKQTLVKWSNGNYVTYQVSNGNWIVRNSSGKQIGIYTAGSTTGKYLTETYISKPTRDAKNNNSSKSNTGDNEGSDTSSSSSTKVSQKKWVQKTVEEPILTYEDALKFAKLEVNKAKRNNGHKIECKVIGSNKFKEGEWALVQIPSFEINEYMYIIKVDHSINSNDEWITGLTLVDYPISISSGESNTVSNDEDSGETSGDDINTDDTSNGSSTSSSSSSSTSVRKSTSKSNKTQTRVNTSFSSKGLNSTSSSQTSTNSQTSVKVSNSNDNWGKNLIGWIASSIRKKITGR